MLNLKQLMTHKRVLLLGGKGGVGKTTLAASLGVEAAAMGRSVLLISTDPAHSFTDIFAMKIGLTPQMVHKNLFALELDADAEVTTYLARVLQQMRSFVGAEQLPELKRHLDLSRQSPGAQEAALLERLAHLLQVGLNDYDLIILDTAPTGHTLRLLSLPEAMAAWTEGLLKYNDRTEKFGQVLAHLTPKKSIHSLSGLFSEPESTKMRPHEAQLVETLTARQTLFRQMRRLLMDHKQSAFILVLTPERLPIMESTRAAQTLIESGVALAGLIINRIIPVQSARNTFWIQRHKQQQFYLEMIQKELAFLSHKHLPLQAEDIVGIEALAKIGQLLTH